MLAAGIGVNAAVFSVANTALFKGFPRVQENDRILYLTGDLYTSLVPGEAGSIFEVRSDRIRYGTSVVASGSRS